MEMDAKMAAWMEFASPSKEHEFLKRLEGAWKAQCKFWMQPGAPPQESEGTLKATLILGGRFLQSHYEGKTTWGEFTGMAIDGYDRIRKKYVGTWMDTMGTIMMVFEGEAQGNVRTMMGDFVDPAGKPNKMKGVTTIVSANEHKYEAWCTTPEGETFQNMEMVYTK